METYFAIAAGLATWAGITAFIVWRGNRSASDAGAAKVEAAQATAEAKASSAALNAAVQGTTDEEIAASLKRGDF